MMQSALLNCKRYHRMKQEISCEEYKEERCGSG